MSFLIQVAEVETWFRILKKTRFFNERTDGFVPIATVLNEPSFNDRKCIKIMSGVLRCLFGLHARGLTQEKLVLEDVFVNKRSVSIFSVILHFSIFSLLQIGIGRIEFYSLCVMEMLVKISVK